MSLPSAELTVAKSLESIEYMPRVSNLMQASDGKMYGMTTRAGKKGYGAIFSYNLLSGTYRKEHDID